MLSRLLLQVIQLGLCGVLLLGPSACSKEAEKANPADPANSVATMIVTVERAREEVCACPNVTCARAAQESYRTWKRTPASLHRRELTAAQADHLGKLELEMQQCVASVQRPPGAETPSPATSR